MLFHFLQKLLVVKMILFAYKGFELNLHAIYGPKLVNRTVDQVFTKFQSTGFPAIRND